MGLADIARHVIGCHVTQASRVQNACQWRGGQYLPRRPYLRLVQEAPPEREAHKRGQRHLVVAAQVEIESYTRKQSILM